MCGKTRELSDIDLSVILGPNFFSQVWSFLPSQRAEETTFIFCILILKIILKIRYITILSHTHSKRISCGQDGSMQPSAHAGLAAVVECQPLSHPFLITQQLMSEPGRSTNRQPSGLDSRRLWGKDTPEHSSKSASVTFDPPPAPPQHTQSCLFPLTFHRCYLSTCFPRLQPMMDTILNKSTLFWFLEVSEGEVPRCLFDF